MIAALRTELRKVSTTRTWWLTALVMFGYMVVMGVIMAFSLVLGMREAEKTGAPTGGGGFGEGAVLDSMAIATSVYTLAVALGYIFPAILGALSVTGEFRHRTITPTLLAEPRRSLVLGSKLVAILPFALVVALAGVVGTVIGGAATLAIMGEPTLLGDSTIQRTLVLSVVALTLWALVGVGFGSVLTNQVAAIVVLLAFTQFVEPLLRLLLAQFDATEAISKFLPGRRGGGDRRVEPVRQLRAGRAAERVAGHPDPGGLRGRAGPHRAVHDVPPRHRVGQGAGPGLGPRDLCPGRPGPPAPRPRRRGTYDGLSTSRV